MPTMAAMTMARPSMWLATAAAVALLGSPAARAATLSVRSYNRGRVLPALRVLLTSRRPSGCSLLGGRLIEQLGTAAIEARREDGGCQGSQSALDQ